MRRILPFAIAILAAAAARADDAPVGRLFFTPAERAALEDARRRNIRAEQLAEEAAKRPAVPRSRAVDVTGIVLRSDGQSVAWVNGKRVEGQTGDGLRVRHTAQPNKVLVYDPDKGRMVPVKVGQRADLTTGRVEEAYERRKREPPAPPEPASEAQPVSAAASGARPAKSEPAAAPDDDNAKGAEAEREPQAAPARPED